MHISTVSEAETFRLGRILGTCLQSGDVVCLNGDLGTGKTAMAKGIAEGLGVIERITSPTFTLVNCYVGRLVLNHFDIYRIDDPEELFAIGFEEYLDAEAVTIIEWAQKLDTPILGAVIVNIALGQHADERQITITGAPEQFWEKIQGDTP